MIGHQNITIYSANRSVQSKTNMFYELWNSRELVGRFFLREISGKYRQSFLGYIWAIIPAITTVIAFSYIRSRGIINVDSNNISDYPAYTLTGLTCWQLFSIGITRTTQCLAKSQALITKINFCRETLIFAAFAESLFEFIIRLPLIIGFYVWFGIYPSWKAIFIPFILLMLSFFTIGLGFILTLVNGVFRDLANAMSLILTFGLLLTPAIYNNSYNGVLNVINPISIFIISINSLIFTGNVSNPNSLALVCIVGIVLFLTGWRFFRIAIPRIAERV